MTKRVRSASYPAFITRSHGAQDEWIYKAAVLGEQLRVGTFLDVGCGHPIDGNNTFELERLGWHGVLVDVNGIFRSVIRENRSSPFVCADAALIDWSEIWLEHALPDVIDYLSFDVDGALMPAFENLPFDRARFRYLTIEHDHYAYGNRPRAQMRVMLGDLGYELLCPDVMCNGLAYEDWWIDPDLVDARMVAAFRTSQPTECHRIVMA
jgi:hypothetical protein